MLALPVLAVTACGSASPATQRADLTSYYSKVGKDLASCNAAIQSGQIALGLVIKGTETAVDADVVAKQAHDACTPGGSNDILDLGTTSVPDSLSGLSIDKAQQDLAFSWAPDAADAMNDLDKLFQNPNDVGAGADYKKTKAMQMDGTLAEAQKFFDDAAKKVGATLKPLALASLS